MAHRSDEADGAGPDEPGGDAERVNRSQAGAVEQLFHRTNAVDPDKQRPIAAPSRVRAISVAPAAPAPEWPLAAPT